MREEGEESYARSKEYFTGVGEFGPGVFVAGRGQRIDNDNFGCGAANDFLSVGKGGGRGGADLVETEERWQEQRQGEEFS